MRRLALAVLLLGALAAPAPAGASVIVNQNGTPNPTAQAWANASQVPGVPGRVQMWPASLCGGWAGCSDWYPASGTAIMHAANRSVFYFEMGHLVDWELLTWPERGTLSHVWGVYGSPWNDSAAAIDAGREDGLEADFAAVFQACAYDVGTSGGLISGDAPAIRVRNTCSLLLAWGL